MNLKSLKSGAWIWVLRFRKNGLQITPLMKTLIQDGLSKFMKWVPIPSGFMVFSRTSFTTHFITIIKTIKNRCIFCRVCPSMINLISSRFCPVVFMICSHLFPYIKIPCLQTITLTNENKGDFYIWKQLELLEE